MNLLLEAQQSVTPEEVAKVDQSLPAADKENSADFIGTLPAELQNLWTFMQRMVAEIEADTEILERKATSVFFSSDYEENLPAIFRKKVVLTRKLNCAKKVFWAEVEAQFGLKEGQQGLALRKGWAVVHYLYPLCVVELRPAKRGIFARLFN
ncbi:MAG: hypothetical protein P4L63_01235 [Candidatus Pacebacteria bacterium]|nr:hypothetical protein [Candidatus Paceibacterota bacterium]